MEVDFGCGLKFWIQKNAPGKGTLVRTEAVERFTPTDSRANTIESEKVSPPLLTCVHGVNSPRSIHELRGLLNSPLRRSRTTSSISPTASLCPPAQSTSKHSIKSSDSSSSTSSMTVREGEYENRSTEIMLEKFADGFGFVVLTKRLDRNGQILIQYH
ncbi:unnamed protein product [Oikopleura dioica]|nr:unnamed protein product [Oikopleura dioica]